MDNVMRAREYLAALERGDAGDRLAAFFGSTRVAVGHRSDFGRGGRNDATIFSARYCSSR